MEHQHPRRSCPSPPKNCRPVRRAVYFRPSPLLWNLKASWPKRQIPPLRSRPPPSPAGPDRPPFSSSLSSSPLLPLLAFFTQEPQLYGNDAYYHLAIARTYFEEGIVDDLRLGTLQCPRRRLRRQRSSLSPSARTFCGPGHQPRSRRPDRTLSPPRRPLCLDCRARPTDPRKLGAPAGPSGSSSLRPKWLGDGCASALSSSPSWSCYGLSGRSPNGASGCSGFSPSSTR